MPSKRAALIVGIGHYEFGDNLHGCANDAERIKELLAFNGDGEKTRNFDCHALICRAPTSHTRCAAR